jgi:two-component system OmpR family response regulator
MFAGDAVRMSAADSVGSARVLVVDDEPNLLELLSAALRMSGFDVHSASDGAQAVALAGEHAPDVMVLDVVLPDVDGFTLARRLRGTHDGVPVLFLTSRDAVADRIAGLTAGGDDYIGKPFSLEEVVLRLRAILRRTQWSTEPFGDACVSYADLTLDEDAHEVRRGNRTVELSPTEFNLLRYLIVNAEKVVSKAQILDMVWSYEYDGDSRIVESYISYLRKKVDARDTPLIHTVRGLGYTLRETRREPAGR